MSIEVANVPKVISCSQIGDVLCLGYGPQLTVHANLDCFGFLTVPTVAIDSFSS